VGQPEQIDHAAAGVLFGQRSFEGIPGMDVFRAGEKPIPVDGSGQRLRLAAQGMDDVPIIDTMNTVPVATTAQARMRDDGGGAEEGLDAVVLDMHAQALADEPGGR